MTKGTSDVDRPKTRSLYTKRHRRTDREVKNPVTSRDTEVKRLSGFFSTIEKMRNPLSPLKIRRKERSGFWSEVLEK